ncbi:hypothetical protein ACFUIV_34025 [Streptomyces anulatus]|uniref:hypothetical protein n=1 Tax=Streptomyces anulatus TaxID=1892 RepID=UPI00362661E8
MLYMHVMDRRGLAAAHNADRQDLVDSHVASVARECRDDLLETAVVLDALALCHGHGSYLPRPYQETSTPVPTDVELRTDASDVADQVVHHDHQHETSTTGDLPARLGTAALTASGTRSAPTPAGSGSPHRHDVRRRIRPHRPPAPSTTPRKARIMTENHPTGQNSTPHTCPACYFSPLSPPPFGRLASSSSSPTWTLSSVSPA